MNFDLGIIVTVSENEYYKLFCESANQFIIENENEYKKFLENK